MHCIFLLVIDLLLLSIANAVAILLSIGPHPTASTLFEILPYGGLTLGIAIPTLLATGLNRTLWRFTSLHDCLRILVAVLMTMAAAIAIASTISSLQGVPRSLMGLQFVLMTGALIGARALMRLRHLRRSRKRAIRAAFIDAREEILVIGVNAITGLFLRCIGESGETRIAVAGILSESHRHRGRFFGSHPILGRPEEIGKITQELDIHGVHINCVVLTKPLEMLSATAQRALLRVANDQSIRIEVLDNLFSLGETATKDTPTNTIHEANAFDPQRRQSYLRWKRAFDVAAGVASAIFLAPLMLFVGALVLLDVGYPIIFWQQRPGTLGLPIKVLKFRTMRAARSADGTLLSDLQRLSVIGKFLRRMRLDELPQILNVLAGEMSIVGPRPLLPIDQSRQFRARLGLKPGLTGWAQINGGRHLSIDEKAVLDLWYVKNASFRLDFRILLRTARTILLGERVNPRAVREAWLALRDVPEDATTDRNLTSTNREQPRRWLGPVNMQIQAPSTESAQPH
ncbi:MAG TPA: sugar transferase [Hyphomicrobium sp.]|jgi:lipopolysaccharide/colanic/teichoic acid biosynthesis glycosyltransferase|nr:sugar transferase [Hyphomicrobium sp.]